VTYHALGLSASSRKYHYRPPPADHPLLLSSPKSHNVLTAAPLPPSIDYRSKMLPIRDQGQEGACSGFSTAANREGSLAIAGQPLPGYLSPAYLYGRTRIAEGSFPADAGATIVDEFGTLQAYGVCPESFLPYQANPAEAPTPAADVAAVPFRIGQPLAVDWSNPANVKQVLASGRLVTIGFSVYQSFESTGSDGIVPAVVPGEALIGGHGVLVVGYDDVIGWWLVRNQWGQGWGDQGYCYMTYGYEANWCEAWTW
jgi:C1A family cysteine protease